MANQWHIEQSGSQHIMLALFLIVQSSEDASKGGHIILFLQPPKDFVGKEAWSMHLEDTFPERGLIDYQTHFIVSWKAIWRKKPSTPDMQSLSKTTV